MAENMAKHMLVTKDSSMEEILDFLEKAAMAGANITTVLTPQTDAADSESDGTHTVAYEARQVKALYLKLYP
jgi:tetratricopeptide repeat protein 30